ncbi:Uncharacterised protein [Mycobacteroides abscessus subsp. abscessus]|nr:Uncharacterised protein [Mycobacteroides abscessus subsp. abscessus]
MELAGHSVAVGADLLDAGEVLVADLRAECAEVTQCAVVGQAWLIDKGIQPACTVGPLPGSESALDCWIR